MNNPQDSLPPLLFCTQPLAPLCADAETTLIMRTHA